MSNIKLYTTTAIIALMTLAAPAFAHDGGAADTAAGHHHHHLHKHDKAAFEKMHALHKKLHNIFVADKFDKQAFLATSAQLEHLRSQMERQHTEEFANKLSTMSQADREALAEKFHEHMMDHHDGWHDGKDWGHKDPNDEGWNDEAHDNDGNHINWSHNAEENGNDAGREIPNH